MINIIDYQFRNQALLTESLTHPSLKSEGNNVNYERLEFLGDSVLGLIIAELLIEKFEFNEGELAKRKAYLVSGKLIAEIGIKINIAKHLIMADSEESMGGRENRNNIENAMEALIGALYIDGGYEVAKSFVLKYWQSYIEKIEVTPKDPKSELQEYLQARGSSSPEYVVVDVSGPDHSPLFTIEAKVNNIIEKASANSKKLAQKKVAEQLLKRLKND